MTMGSAALPPEWPCAATPEAASLAFADLAVGRGWLSTAVVVVEVEAVAPGDAVTLAARVVVVVPPEACVPAGGGGAGAVA